MVTSVDITHEIFSFSMVYHFSTNCSFDIGNLKTRLNGSNSVECGLKNYLLDNGTSMVGGFLSVTRKQLCLPVCRLPAALLSIVTCLLKLMEMLIF